MEEKNHDDLSEYQAYWQLAEEMITGASKEELAEALRILSMQTAYYSHKCSETEAPVVSQFVATTAMSPEYLNLLKVGSVTLVGILGAVSNGLISNDQQQVH